MNTPINLWGKITSYADKTGSDEFSVIDVVGIGNLTDEIYSELLSLANHGFVRFQDDVTGGSIKILRR